MDWIFTNLNIVTALKHELADYNQIEELFHVILIVKILEFSNCSLTIITNLLNYNFCNYAFTADPIFQFHGRFP